MKRNWNPLWVWLGLILGVPWASAGQAPGASAPTPEEVLRAPAGGPSAKPDVSRKNSMRVAKSRQPSKRSGGSVLVSGIAIKAEPSGATVVEVRTTRPSAYRVMQLENPSRLVVDFEGARHNLRRLTYAAQSPLLADVRVGQFRSSHPAVVRVVADLIGAPAFDVSAETHGVRIQLTTQKRAEVAVASPQARASVIETKAEEAAPVQPAAPAAGAGVAPETSPSLASGTQAALAVNATQPAPTEHANAAQNAPAASLENVSPPSRPEKAAPSDYKPPLPPQVNTTEVAATPREDHGSRSPEALRAANAARIFAASMQNPPAPPTPATEPQAEPQAKPPQPAPGAVAPSAASSAVAGMEQAKYTGEPISLNLKDLDLKDFFRFIHEISGLNILVDPNVTGTVTLVLDSVPWDQALDIVLKNAQLGRTLEGNVLRIARLDTLTAEQEAATKLVAARDLAQPLVTRFVPINYAKAATISTMIKGWVGGGALTTRGNILVDDRTNTLIISDIATRIPTILDIIGKLDTKAKQVSIEARIVRATRDFTRNLASALALGVTNTRGNTVAAGLSADASSATVSLPTPKPITVSSQTGTGFGVFAISNVGSQYVIDAVLTAAETKAQARTISKPTIVTQNNTPGTVTQGTQIPIQTTINNTISISYVSASLTLTVTPQVTQDGHIFMVITVSNSSPGAVLTSAGPSITTQSATTQVLVPDGGTVIFGGVTINASSHSATYVPVLGQIPIIGHLFKSTISTKNDQELLFFVTPKIMPG